MKPETEVFQEFLAHKGMRFTQAPVSFHERTSGRSFISLAYPFKALGQIFSGKLGGLPWELLGPTFEVVGLVKAPITIEGSGRRSTYRVEGVGEGRGNTFKNPVTGEEHLANIADARRRGIL